MNPIRLLSVALSLLVCLSAVRAATISGNVSNLATGNLLQGARVEIPALSRTVLSDATGRYVLADLPAGQRLRVLEFGFGGPSFAESLYAGIDFDRVDYSYCVQEPELVQMLGDECPALEVLGFDQLSSAQAYDWVLLPSDLAPLDSVGEALRQTATATALASMALKATRR